MAALGHPGLADSDMHETSNFEVSLRRSDGYKGRFQSDGYKVTVACVHHLVAGAVDTVKNNRISRACRRNNGQLLVASGWRREQPLPLLCRRYIGARSRSTRGTTRAPKQGESSPRFAGVSCLLRCHHYTRDGGIEQSCSLSQLAQAQENDLILLATVHKRRLDHLFPRHPTPNNTTTNLPATRL